MKPHGAARFPQRHVRTTKGQERRKLCTGAARCSFVPDAASVVSALQGLLYRLPSGRPDFFKFHLTIPCPLWYSTLGSGGKIRYVPAFATEYRYRMSGPGEFARLWAEPKGNAKALRQKDRAMTMLRKARFSRAEGAT